jgi:DNA mismatch repair protein MutS
LCDLERIISRINFGLANPRDLVALRQTLQMLPVIKEVSANLSAPLIVKNTLFADLSLLAIILDKAIKDEPPITVREGHFIKRGYSHELDEYHNLSTNAKEVLAKIEADEAEKTGIPTLKVKYNRVFGYYLEVTNKYKDKIPANYVRKQSTVNGERFVTPELSELEGKILGAQEKIYELEYKLFVELCEQIKTQTSILQDVAAKIATIDVLCSFASTSVQNRYVMPTISDDFMHAIFDGRHPVIEQTHRDFIPNDCVLTNNERMMIITGPNMAGKSTYMRQVALITLLAHIGCFVPAREATISIVDRLFSRVGALDDISKGQSTFMVEMTETASILHNATRKSLIILDEIGSGTSTYDGVSIAWAVGLDLVRRVRAKTMFSTHYHVLTKLEEEAGVFNVHSAVLEADDHITFLRKIVRGGTDKSYGIHVATSCMTR